MVHILEKGVIIFIAFCTVYFCFVGLRYVSCVSNVACVSGLSILIAPLVFSEVNCISTLFRSKLSIMYAMLV